jgi:hypothetical protein
MPQRADINQLQKRETMFNDTKSKYRDKFTIGYTYHANGYCYECGSQLPEIDPEGNEKHPIATWDRNDSPTWKCAECDLPITEWGF